MMKRLLPAIPGLILMFITVYCTAQKKNFSYDQLFKSSVPNISKPLPEILGWANDDQYLESRKDVMSGIQKIMAIDVKTGQAVPYKYNEPPHSNPSIDMLRLTGNEKNISFSPDGKWAAYTRNNNLFAMEVGTKKEVQFTTDGSDSILNGYASWVYFEEIFGRPSNYKAFWWSPDSKRLAFMRFDDSPVPVYPIFVSEGQHGYFEYTRFPKPGDKNPEVRVGVTTVANPTIVWADFDQKEDQYFGMPAWTPTGQFWVQWMNRGQDTLKIFNIDVNTGIKKIVYEEKQPTWIKLKETNRLEFLNSGNAFILKSDKDGWENLYLHHISGKLLNKITTGSFWGTEIVKIDEQRQLIYFRARKENSSRYDFYRIRFSGKNLARLSFGNYSHDKILLSPGGKYFVTTFSNVSSPPKMSLVDQDGRPIRELGDSKGPDFDEYNIPETKILTVRSTDSLFELPITITYPVNFDAGKKYPVLITIYGGPNAGTVFDRWKTFAASTQWWAQEGIVQVVFDNRSSGHFGKIGQNYVYRNLGKWEIEDYMTCGRWLRSQSWVDTSKVAMTGGSFGGYMTCLALTYGSDVFTHGIANSPVTDWQLYDSHYTERFMDAPEENAEGYKNTSVMSYVEDYKGLLRIVHGTSDDNVHIQHSLQLVDALQNRNKYFEFMIYPGERHSIGANNALKGVHNQTESYKFWYRHLLNSPLPEFFKNFRQ